MNSKPVCEVPKCRVICNPPEQPICTVKTSAPVCKTVCNKIDGCYNCTNVCQPLKTWLDCVKQDPVCQVKCDPPNCTKESFAKIILNITHWDEKTMYLHN